MWNPENYADFEALLSLAAETYLYGFAPSAFVDNNPGYNQLITLYKILQKPKFTLVDTNTFYIPMDVGLLWLPSSTLLCNQFS